MIENIRLSFQGIWAHKMRSFLTMLGIIIGIAFTYLLCLQSKEQMNRLRKTSLAKEIMW